MQSRRYELRRSALSLLLLSAGCTLVNSRAGLAHDEDSVSDGSDGNADGAGDDWGDGDDDSSRDSDGGLPSIDGDPDGDGDGDGDGSDDDGVDMGDGGMETGGDAAMPPPKPYLYEKLVQPRGITVHGNDVCWVAGDPRSLYCAPKDGSGPVTDITFPSDREKLAGAFDLVLDDQDLYWSNGQFNEVLKRPRSGGTPSAYFTGSGTLSYIALREGFVFASDYRGPDVSGNIMRGPHGTDINGVGQSMLIYPAERGASGVAIVGEVVFYGTHDSLAFGDHFGNDDQLKHVPAGGTVQGVAVDARLDAYFLVANQRLYKLSRNTVTPELVYESAAPFGEGDVALDDEWVYWSERDLGFIKRARR